jgi:hypothetical protein
VLRGGSCWDVIDVLSLHSYARTPATVLAKLTAYSHTFADDMAGTGGRSPKRLWLTEVAAASNDVDFVAAFARTLMSTSGGLADRAQFGHVERVSWFSELSFASFNMSGYTPRPNEAWVSALFNPYGGLTPVGEAFFANCAAA